jgi:hypothetical protein
MKRGTSFIAFWTAAATVVGILADDPVMHPGHAQAPDWPTRPMTLVVPFFGWRIERRNRADRCRRNQQ